MSSKTKTVLALIPRMLLGLIYFVFGLNFFFPFLPEQRHPEGAAGAYLGGLLQSGYFFPLLKSVEVIAGLLLLIGSFVTLALVVLAPISLHILLFHTVLAPAGAPIGILILVLHIYLAYAYRDQYKALFVRKPALS